MVKKLSVLLALVVCTSFVHQANAGVVAGNNTKLFWRDGFGDPFDGYVEATPGDMIFVQLEVNSNQWSAVRNTQINVWWDTNDFDYVAQEFQPYAHLKDYSNGGGFEDWSTPSGGALTVQFGGSNVYIYTGGPGLSIQGAIPLGYDYMGIYGPDPGGLLLGFYIQISPTASPPMTALFFNVQVRGMALDSSSWAWEEELSSDVNPEWALGIFVPEPATISLLAIGGVVALIRRKK